MSRAEDVLAHRGGEGGHAGYLVRALHKSGRYDQAAVDLLAELVGRMVDLEKTVGALHGELMQARRAAAEKHCENCGKPAGGGEYPCCGWRS
jgi:hypothetical protein